MTEQLLNLSYKVNQFYLQLKKSSHSQLIADHHVTFLAPDGTIGIAEIAWYAPIITSQQINALCDIIQQQLGKVTLYAIYQTQLPAKKMIIRFKFAQIGNSRSELQ